LITQLVYTSSATFDPASRNGAQHISAILKAARSYNSTVGVSGFLLVGEDWFAQILEGQAAEVTALFRRILFDRRHTNVHIIETRQAGERLFADWAMGCSAEPLSAPLRQLIEPIRQDRLDFPFDRIVARAVQEAQSLRRNGLNS
jgi:hypothetical protein